jgi:hypothetical protein
MKNTDRIRKTVWVALGFRVAALVYEIIMIIVLLLYFIPMMISQKLRNTYVDGFMTELKENFKTRTNGKINQRN